MIAIPPFTLAGKAKFTAHIVSSVHRVRWRPLFLHWFGWSCTGRMFLATQLAAIQVAGSWQAIEGKHLQGRENNSHFNH